MLKYKENVTIFFTAIASNLDLNLKKNVNLLDNLDLLVMKTTQYEFLILIIIIIIIILSSYFCYLCLFIQFKVK